MNRDIRVVAEVEYATPTEFHSLGRVMLFFKEGVEICNRSLIEHLEKQYPRVVAKIPTWTDARGFTFRHGINLKVLEQWIGGERSA
jgi:hypothetical protein